MKRLTAVFLISILFFTAIPDASAVNAEAISAADNLYNFGLFTGTGADAQGNPIYDLERAPTRQEAITMFVRILGKDEEAMAETWETPFTDVDEWAKPYVGYAYANNLTSGIGAMTFGGQNEVTATQYITFILRALGYSSDVDFQWDKAWELSVQIGLTDGRYSDSNNDSFLRGDLVIVSNNALRVNMKGTAQPLISTIPSIVLPWKLDRSVHGYDYMWRVIMSFSADSDSDLHIKKFEYNYINERKVIASGSFDTKVLGTDRIMADERIVHTDIQVNRGFDRIEYLLYCIDKNGNEVILINTFAIVRDFSLIVGDASNIAVENVYLFRLANMLGGVTLSVAEANALVGESPETIKDQVKTAGDMLMYMIAAQFGIYDGDQQINAGGLDWHYNHTARHTLDVNAGNCGATSNLANFLLEGDYDEVGFVSYSALPGAGGHVLNYIKYDNKYYIVDFVHYAGDNYNPFNEFNVIALNSLEDFGRRWPECYGGIEAMVAYTSGGTHFPVSIDPAATVFPAEYLLPEGTDFIVLFESENVKVGTAHCPTPPVPDWRLPQ